MRDTRIAKFLVREAVHVDPVTKKKYRFLERGKTLDKYKGQDDVFGTFTSIFKLGVFPGSGYNTPVGVYCYPIDFIIKSFNADGIFQVPYPPEDKQKYLQIFRVGDVSRCLVFRSGEDKLISNLRTGFTQEEVVEKYVAVKRSVEKIHRYYEKKLTSLDLSDIQGSASWFYDVVLYNDRLSYELNDRKLNYEIADYFGMPHSYALMKDRNVFEDFLDSTSGEKIKSIKISGDIPNIMPLLKNIYSQLKTNVKDKDIQLPYEKYLKSLFYMVKGNHSDYGDFKKIVADEDQRIDTDQSYAWNFTRHLSGFNPRTWTVLLRRLGFIGAIDYGTSTIHENEPTQAVFFDPPSIQRVEVIENQVPQYDTSGDSSKDSRTLSKWTRESFDDRAVFRVMENDIDIVKRRFDSLINKIKKLDAIYSYSDDYYLLVPSLNNLYKTWGWINTHPALVDQDFWSGVKKRIKASLDQIMVEYWKIIQELPDVAYSKQTVERIYKKMRLLDKILG